MNSRSLGIGAIDFYQRKLSPRKGFRCAHAACHGGWSCSEFGRRSLQKYGYRKSFPLLWRRFQACHLANEKMKEERRWRDLGGECLSAFSWADVGCCFLSMLLDF